MKQALKMFAHFTSVALSLPVYFMYICFSFVFGKKQIFSFFSQLYSIIPGALGAHIRLGFYWLSLPGFPRNFWMDFGSFFSTPKIYIGNNVYIGAYCIISNCTIEDDVLIGSHVNVISGKQTHSFDDTNVPIRMQPSQESMLTIGSDSWIGNATCILSDINPHTVVGAGSVVVKTFPAYSVIAGNPARLLRSRLDNSSDVLQSKESA